MTPDDEAQIQQCGDIARILYRNAPPEQLQTLEGIKQVIRAHTQQTVLAQSWLSTSSAFNGCAAPVGSRGVAVGRGNHGELPNDW